MATKELKTKIALRYLDYATWSADAFKTEKPLKGEVWFCEIPTGNANATTAPTMLFKVGDGTNTFGDLKWASALAADVYGWAKKEHLDLADLPDIPVVDEGTGKFVTGVTWDQTNNKIVITRANVALDDISDKEKIALVADMGNKANLNEAITNRDTLVDAINAVRTEALNAVNVGGTGSVITVRKENKNKYVVTQGGNDIDAPIEIADATLDVKVGGGLAGTDVQFSANATENKEITISHGNTSDAANLVADGRKYVTGLTFDDYGHVTGYTTGEEVDQDLTHNHDAQYKKLQTAYTKELTGAQVVAKVEQNANGDVTVTERTLTAADLGLDTVMHFIGAYAEAPTKAFAGTANERDLANGDVYLNTANATEYVYSNGKWVELGNEEGAGSHALKTITITGTGYLAGGGDLSVNRTIDIAPDAKTKIDNGATAYGWGNHADAGYAKNDDLNKVISGETPVAKATDADTLGTHGVDYFATQVSVEAIPGTIDSKITAYNASKNFGDIITHNAAEFASKAQGDKADTALQEIEADTGLKIVEGTNNKVAIDEDVIFILNCN